MKHSPLIRLANARRNVQAARECCPHWDYEADGEADACCREVAAAERELRLAKAAVAKGN